MESALVDFMERRSECVCYKLLDLWENVSLHIEVQVWLLSVYDFCKVLEAHLICVFVLTVVLRLVLDGIVCQMHQRVAHVVEVVLTGAGPHVAVLIAVAFQGAVNAGQHPVHSKVELPLVDKQGVVDVLLNYEGAVLSRLPLNNLLNLFHVFHHLDALPPVGVFARLDYPSVLGSLVLLAYCLDLLLFVRVVVARVVDCLLILLLVLVVLLDGLLDHFVAALDLVLEVIVVTDKFAVVWVMDSLGRVESQGQDFERVHSHGLVVLAHVDKDAFLVCELLVVFNPVVQLQGDYYWIRLKADLLWEFDLRL